MTYAIFEALEQVCHHCDILIPMGTIGILYGTVVVVLLWKIYRKAGPNSI